MSHPIGVGTVDIDIEKAVGGLPIDIPIPRRDDCHLAAKQEFLGVSCNPQLRITSQSSFKVTSEG
jgi:hypothetical protein